MKTFKSTLVLALTLLLTAGPVSAARWKPVKLAQEQSIYVDVDALVRTGNTVQAWDWQKYDSPQTSENLQATFFWVKSLTNYHCVRRTTDAVLKIYFGADGIEIKRVHLEGLRFPAAVEPDSMREKLLETACNPPKPDAKPAAIAKKTEEKKPATASTANQTDEKAGTVKTAETTAEKSADKTAEKTAEKAAEKPGAKLATRKSIVPALANASSAGGISRPVFRRTYTLPPLTQSREKKIRPVAATTDKVAHRKNKSAALCPPQPAHGSQKNPPSTVPQFSDAGSDGLFN